MAINYTCITRKIEVRLHKRSDTSEGLELFREQNLLWDDINANLYKAANRIVSHCFFNDSYEYRVKLQSPRFQEIERLLRYAKRNNLSVDEVKQLKAERNLLLKDFKLQRQTFLRGGISEGSNPEQNSTYKVASHEFLNVIPADVITNLNQIITSTYKQQALDVENGNRSVANYKKGIPVPFSIKNKGELLLKKRDDGSIYVQFPKGLEWDLCFGRDRSNNKEIVERVLCGMYDAGNSSIQQAKNKKCFLLLVVKIPQETNNLNPNRVLGIDLGICTPLYAALNDDEYDGMSIGSKKAFLEVRMQMSRKKRELQRELRDTTKGGHGRKQKLQALNRLEGKERNWVHLQNHIFSKTIVEFAIKNRAGVIQMERLTGFGRDSNDEIEDKFKFVLRYWSFYELQEMIEYKAKAAGIEVRYINPYHTSQTCSFCGHYEPEQRVSQSVFICKNPDCIKGKGKQKSDGTYSGINADWNAARNISLSNNIVAKKKK